MILLLFSVTFLSTTSSKIAHASESISIELSDIPEGWEFEEVPGGWKIVKMPLEVQEALDRKYSMLEGDISTQSLGLIILVKLADIIIGEIVKQGFDYTFKSFNNFLVTGAVITLAIATAGNVLSPLSMISLGGPKENPYVREIRSTNGCVSRDGGLNWMCP